jgi:hypothetical protein
MNLVKIMLTALCAFVAPLLGSAATICKAQCIVEEVQRTTEVLSEDDFGDAVATDGTTAVVGQQIYHWNSQMGHAFVYRYDGCGWRREDDFGDSGPTYTYDHFGESVAVNGDVIAVGAPDDRDLIGAEAGAVLIFRFNGTQWMQEAKLGSAEIGRAHV